MDDPRHPATSPKRVPTLDELGWSDRWHALAGLDARRGDDDPSRPARVLRHDGPSVLVGDGTDVRHVQLRPATPPIAVGDWVLADGDVVLDVLERSSVLRRRDPGTGFEQLIAANLDVVVVVAGLDRPVRPGRIERLVTLAWDAGAVPVVVLTKADLLDESDVAELGDVARSAAPAVDVLVVGDSGDRDGQHLDGLGELRSAVEDRTVAFVGESGAGKSTLLNRLAGRDAALVGSVREGDSKGRHTTTSRQLHVLDRCRVIDTPGVREVGVWAEGASVDDAFEDITGLGGGCRFRDCAHEDEPGCAVAAAVASGALDADRVGRWRDQRREAAAAELRGDEAARRRRDRQRGLVAREAQRMKRRDG